jgi:ATP-binding cassette subfamily B protein
MITIYWGRDYSIQSLRDWCGITQSGVNLFNLHLAAEKIGFESSGVRLTPERLNNVQLPCVLHWGPYHYVVLYKIHKGEYYIADPSSGLVRISENDFKENWIGSDDRKTGNALILTPTPRFYSQTGEKESKLDWRFIARYFFTYKQLLFQLCLALLAGSLIQLIIPFLTQSIVDTGISGHNLSFIHVILIAQLMLMLGSTCLEFLRSWILLHISTKVSISIITDFLIKIMKLPVSFFDTKTTGDIMQRISDEKRIENFLTGSALQTLFSGFNFIAFSIIIALYNLYIFAVFALATLMYIGWVTAFLEHRKRLDYKLFSTYSTNQDNLIEVVNGMKEIKLHNKETIKRWQWEHVQAKLFKLNTKLLALTQYQQAGATFINHGKNILITYLSARAVIEGDMTLGAMMSIQFIIGQLNGPVEQFIGFIRAFQDAKISVERLNEIHSQRNEEKPEHVYVTVLNEDQSIVMRGVNFRFRGNENELVLNDIDLVLPQGKTTAVVGMSGSGKTTLLKLLLRFYEPSGGTIQVGGINLEDIDFKIWRNSCGAVMQEGYIFADTLMNNITMGEQTVSNEKLDLAIRIANLGDIIERLPNGINSRIGSGSMGLSKGQVQRVLIARAIYKDPDYLFFDEATNALDANNEKTIVENLSEFLKGKTVVLVAHRLSSVKNADNIILMDNGKIIEQGTHAELVANQKAYFNLVKNQIEVGA